MSTPAPVPSAGEFDNDPDVIALKKKIQDTQDNIDRIALENEAEEAIFTARINEVNQRCQEMKDQCQTKDLLTNLKYDMGPDSIMFKIARYMLAHKVLHAAGVVENAGEVDKNTGQISPHGKGQSIGDRLIGIGTLVNEKQAIVLPILDEYVRIIEKNLWRSESFSEKLGYEVPEEYRTLRVALRDMVEEHLKRLGIDETAREGWLNDSHGHGENGNDKEDGAVGDISIKKGSEKESSLEGQEWETATEGMGDEAEA